MLSSRKKTYSQTQLVDVVVAALPGSMQKHHQRQSVDGSIGVHFGRFCQFGTIYAVGEGVGSGAVCVCLEKVDVGCVLAAGNVKKERHQHGESRRFLVCGQWLDSLFQHRVCVIIEVQKNDFFVFFRRLPKKIYFCRYKKRCPFCEKNV